MKKVEKAAKAMKNMRKVARTLTISASFCDIMRFILLYRFPKLENLIFGKRESSRKTRFLPRFDELSGAGMGRVIKETCLTVIEISNTQAGYNGKKINAI